MSHLLPICAVSNHFPDLSLAFFWLTGNEISEQANRQVPTEEPNRKVL